MKRTVTRVTQPYTQVRWWLGGLLGEEYSNANQGYLNHIVVSSGLLV